jgi:hypothetical protein
MRHAAVVVTLAPSNSESAAKNNFKDKDISEKTDSKDIVKDSNVATHHIVPLEDEVLQNKITNLLFSILQKDKIKIC